MPDPSRRTSSAERALLALAGIDDGVVLERVALDGSSWLVAYVVPTGAPLIDAWREAMRSVLADTVGIAFVAISAVPLTGDGEPDVPALAALPVLDPTLSATGDEALASLRGVERSMMRIELDGTRPTRSHLSDLLPSWTTAAAATVAADEAGTEQVAAHGHGRTSVATGAPLTLPVPRNLSTALHLAATTQPEHGVTCVDASGRESFHTYPQLLEDAERLLGGLRARRLAPGDAVLLQLDHDRDVIAMFWACALGGFVPVPVGVPPGVCRPPRRRRQTARRLGTARPPGGGDDPSAASRTG